MDIATYRLNLPEGQCSENCDCDSDSDIYCDIDCNRYINNDSDSCSDTAETEKLQTFRRAGSYCLKICGQEKDGFPCCCFLVKSA